MGNALTKFDPRGLLFLNNGQLLISDSSDPLYTATAKDFQLFATAQLSWDLNPNTSGLGGTGNWNASTANWTISAGGTGPNFAWPNMPTTDALFDGTPGVVTISEAGIAAHNLTFNVAGYVIAGAFPLTLGPGATIATLTGTTTISAEIAGTNGFTKTGLGTFLLSGNNRYSGTTFVQAGLLQAGSITAFSPNSAFSIGSGATLALAGFSNTVGSISGGGVVTNSGASASTLTVVRDDDHYGCILSSAARS